MSRRPTRLRRTRWLWLAAAVLLGLAVARLSWPSVEPDLRLHLSLPRVRAQQAVLLRAATETGLDPELLAAVMYVESSGRPAARSSKGALGLFQLMPGTAGDMARELGLPSPSEEQLLTDAELNARLGARYLVGLVRRFGIAGIDATDVEPALIAYNTGPARLERYLTESGGWQAWRAERAASGTSSLLGYAQRVLRARNYYLEQQLFATAIAHPTPPDDAH